MTSFLRQSHCERDGGRMTDPTRRNFLLGSMALAPLAACSSERLDVGAGMPNIILCMADDQGWGDTGYNGHPYLKTPHLDAMSRAGLRVDRFYSGAPVCSPTRGSALTGRHPYRYGVPTANAGHVREGEITLAELLKGQGYATGHFGKWHLGTLTNDQEDGRRGGRRPEHYAPPWEHGFDQSFSAEVQMPTWDPMENQAFPSKYWTGEGEYATENLEGDDSRVIMDRAIPFIQQSVAANTPFFAVIWFHAPHRPVVAGPQHRAMYAEFSEGEQHYYGCITALDEQVGRLRRGPRRIEWRMLDQPDQFGRAVVTDRRDPLLHGGDRIGIGRQAGLDPPFGHPPCGTGYGLCSQALHSLRK